MLNPTITDPILIAEDPSGETDGGREGGGGVIIPVLQSVVLCGSQTRIFGLAPP